ncbi:hypothetical protein [Lactococcus fujiensis]|uniref:Uncharacterized protein n=1 Tax=Lactococcus fujiensis JCM 16395 TaxID=1291764 RepID=A0A2A5RNV7_9LACT|nr:hypothetical protein [Lactococcus fujiensis]PCS01052.1 hypothetical protein RT41_GL000842 [Lactococcus fujiensis JCM 16395]
MKLQDVKIKKRFKFENLGLLLLLAAIVSAITSMYLFTTGESIISNLLAKLCIVLFVTAWLMITYGQHAKNHKKIIIKVVNASVYSDTMRPKRSF